ncbi:MAG: ribosome maturation factor RimP [Syntrophomonadaceae bacterium]|nr:ribosome maturation factor RimP [Syntrophomonadaceae bacterium]
MAGQNLNALQIALEKELERAEIGIAEISCRKEKNGQILRIYIDHEPDVTMDICVQASKIIKKWLDTEDFFYDHLEVSSPGLDRVLKTDKDFRKFQNNKVQVNVCKAFVGPRKFAGVLRDFDEDNLYLSVGEEAITLPRTVISQVRLQPDL